jgi:hypothetical protein
MLKANQQLLYPVKGDFMVDERYTFYIKNGYVISDEIEVGFGNKIPLWLFGFLY